MADHVSRQGWWPWWWEGRTALHRPADQTSPSTGLTEEQDTPQSAGWDWDWDSFTPSDCYCYIVR